MMSSRMRLIIGPLMLIVLAFGFATLGTEGGGDGEIIDLEANQVTYESLGQLSAAADRIVIGRVTEVQDGRSISAPGNPDQALRTELATVVVGESLKGGGNSEVEETLVVEQEAKTGGGVEVRVAGIDKLRVEDEVLMFLNAGDSEQFPHHAVLNSQSQYFVTGVQRNELRSPSQNQLSMQLAALGPSGLRCAVLQVTGALSDGERNECNIENNNQQQGEL